MTDMIKMDVVLDAKRIKELVPDYDDDGGALVPARPKGPGPAPLVGSKARQI